MGKKEKKIHVPNHIYIPKPVLSPKIGRRNDIDPEPLRKFRESWRELRATLPEINLAKVVGKKPDTEKPSAVSKVVMLKCTFSFLISENL